MKQKSRAIILHTTDYSSTSLIVKAYTEFNGSQSFIVSGVRSLKGKFNKSIFQPLSLVEIVYKAKAGSGLGRILEIELAPSFSNIPFDINRSSIAIFLAEVLYKSIREEEKNIILFEFLHTSIQLLDAEETDCSKFHIAFLIQLTKYIGIYPSGNCVAGNSYFNLRDGIFTDKIPAHNEFTSRETALNLYNFIKAGYSEYRRINISNLMKQDLISALVMLFEIHQTHGTKIKSHEVLHEILH